MWINDQTGSVRVCRGDVLGVYHASLLLCCWLQSTAQWDVPAKMLLLFEMTTSLFQKICMQEQKVVQKICWMRRWHFTSDLPIIVLFGLISTWQVMTSLCSLTCWSGIVASLVNRHSWAVCLEPLKIIIGSLHLDTTYMQRSKLHCAGCVHDSCMYMKCLSSVLTRPQTLSWKLPEAQIFGFASSCLSKANIYHSAAQAEQAQTSQCSKPCENKALENTYGCQ